jgi:hypothetical protein
MQHYDHGLIGATLGIAVGAHRRLGWAAVVLASLAAMFPDWDDVPHPGPGQPPSHRFWGHNLFAVTLGGIILGATGYLIQRSLSHRTLRPPPDELGQLRAWVVLGLGIMLIHPFLDLLYCGVERNADWPVGLLWPIVQGGYALPWMPWSDRGATAILSAGLLLSLAVRRYSQLFAVASLVLLAVYVAIRGALLHWM